MKSQPRRRSMQLKLNALVIGCILAVALGLMAISYHVFCRRVDDEYYSSMNRAVEACAENIYPGLLIHFWESIDTEEFRTLRDQAAETGDEHAIEVWMRSKPGFYNVVPSEETPQEQGEQAAADETADVLELWSLFDDYQQLQISLKVILEYFNVDYAYYQIDVDGVTYNIMDPSRKIFDVGTVEAPIKEFSSYPDNADVPPTVYHSQYGWLCTAMRAIRDMETGEAVYQHDGNREGALQVPAGKPSVCCYPAGNRNSVRHGCAPPHRDTAAAEARGGSHRICPGRG